MNNQHPLESLWYSRSKFVWLLWPLNLIFLLIVILKRVLYRLNFISSSRFSKPVLVVGNITIGGTGKTPFINQLIRILAKNNIRAGIVSRGYQSKVNRYPHQVMVGDLAAQVGDEAYMQFIDLEIPIVIDPDRSRAVRYLIEQNNVDLVISDDGMQHYKMTRDIEVLLFDGERQFGNQLILPFGPLREPTSRLNSVDFVIQNGRKENNYAEYNVDLVSKSLINLKTGKAISIEDFCKNCVHAVAGIGNPQRFYNSLAEICEIKSKTSFTDHYQFLVEDFRPFANEVVVMTEKDASKCFPFAQDNWYYLKVEMTFGQKLTDQLLEKIQMVIGKDVARNVFS